MVLKMIQISNRKLGIIYLLLPFLSFFIIVYLISGWYGILFMFWYMLYGTLCFSCGLYGIYLIFFFDKKYKGPPIENEHSFYDN